jgi:preprotein translocase subunit SecG
MSKKNNQTNLEKILTSSQNVMLDDVVSNILKISSQYFVLLIIVLIILLNIYISYLANYNRTSSSIPSNS